MASAIETGTVRVDQIDLLDDAGSRRGSTLSGRVEQFMS